MIGAPRDALKARLEAAGVTVVPFVPEELVAPCVVLAPAENYIEERETFSREHGLNLDAYPLVELVDNETATAELDQLLAVLIPALDPEFTLLRMSRPGPFHTASWLAHGARLSLFANTTLTNPGDTP